MTTAFGKGSRVKWNWSGKAAEGKVDEVFRENVTRTIKGSEITRNASSEEPAYLIVQHDGDRVLKSHRELERA